MGKHKGPKQNNLSTNLNQNQNQQQNYYYRAVQVPSATTHYPNTNTNNNISLTTMSTNTSSTNPSSTQSGPPSSAGPVTISSPKGRNPTPSSALSALSNSLQFLATPSEAQKLQAMKESMTLTTSELRALERQENYKNRQKLFQQDLYTQLYTSTVRAPTESNTNGPNSEDSEGPFLTPRTTVDFALRSLNELQSQPLTDEVRTQLSQLMFTLKDLRNVVQVEGQNKNANNDVDDTLAYGGVIPRTKLKELFENAAEQTSNLKWQISTSYRDAPELRENLNKYVGNCHYVLRGMYRALNSRLAVQTAINACKELLAQIGDLGGEMKDRGVELVGQLMEILGKMGEMIPGASLFQKLTQTASELISQIYDLLFSSSNPQNLGLIPSISKKLEYRLNNITDYLNSCKDRTIKFSCLNLGLDTLDDINNSMDRMCMKGIKEVERIQREHSTKLFNMGSTVKSNSTSGKNNNSGSNNNSNNSSSLSPQQQALAQQKIEQSVNNAIASFKRSKQQYSNDIYLAKEKIISFQQELSCLNEYNLTKLKSLYEDCFIQLQTLYEHKFLNELSSMTNPNNVPGGGTSGFGGNLGQRVSGVLTNLSESINMNSISTTSTNIQGFSEVFNNIDKERKIDSKIRLVGELLQETVARQHKNSTFLSCGLRYSASLVSIRQAVKVVNSLKNSIKKIVPYNKEIGELFEKAYKTIAELFMFEKIAGLLPIEFVQEMFYNAWEAFENLRYFIMDMAVGMKDGLISVCGKVVTFCAESTSKGIEYTVSSFISLQNFISDQIYNILNLLSQARQSLFKLSTSTTVNTAITADRWFHIVSTLELLLIKAREYDQKILKDQLGLNNNIEEFVYMPLVKPVLNKSLGLAVECDDLVTGGIVRGGVESVLEEYVIRGGRLIEVGK